VISAEVRVSGMRLAGLLFLLFVIVPCARSSAQQVDDCPLPAALISPDQPAYADAMSLKKNLESQGLVIRCIFATKFSSQFIVWENGKPRSTVEGEACIRTNLGDLDVLFMSRPRNFDDLKIKERRDGRGYLYTFSGMPDVWPRNLKHIGSIHHTYYFRIDNYLLSVGSDELRNAVEAALHYPPLSL
jgi:hypothetical protein